MFQTIAVVIFIDDDIVPILATQVLLTLTLEFFDMTLFGFGSFLATWYDKMIQSQLEYFLSQAWSL